jgi:L-Ala-D/L-Glu epimerase
MSFQQLLLKYRTMRIEQIKLYKTRVPFQRRFSHALSSGAYAENVVLEVLADHGEVKGYGECAPRPYVTGETQDSVSQSIDLFLKSGYFPWDLEDVFRIWDFVDHLPDGRVHHAALCALETALLDLLGKEQGSYVIEYLPKDYLCESIYYGAAIPMDGEERILEICRRIEELGIRRIKVKVGKNFDQNVKILDAVCKVFETRCDLKIDVNGAWDREAAFKHVSVIVDHGIKVVEQPMMPGNPDMDGLADKMKPYGVKLMADESACSLSEVKGVLSEGQYNMINVRLSKCGGYRRSLRIIDYLRENKIPFQIGCQLGESGLLSAAGRILSLLCKDATYHDGSYDAFLLRENITETHVSFGPKGKAGPLGGTGLGVKVNARNLELLSDQSGIICFRRP